MKDLFIEHLEGWQTVRDLPLELLRSEVSLDEMKALCSDPTFAPSLPKLVSELERLMQPGDTIRRFSAGNIAGMAVVRNGAIYRALVTIMH